MKNGKIGIIANTGKKKAVEYAFRLSKWLSERGVEVFFDKEVAEKIGDSPGFDKRELASQSDVIVVLGGDGTLLTAVRAIREFQVPLLGINLGTFGFMTVVNLDEIYSAMELILAGEFTTSRRMMLDASIMGDKDYGVESSALNDIVINRGSLSRMIKLETFVNDEYLAMFNADGLIISTPTGSTAYSLSAGGPIVFPDLKSVIISPICPHTLTNRPIVLPPEAVIKIILQTNEERAPVTLDGQLSFVLKSGDTITIKRSKYFIELINSPQRNYIEILRGKLGWGGRP